MRAAAEQHGAIRGPNRYRVPPAFAELRRDRQGRGYSLAFCLNVRVVFDAASAFDSVVLYANSLPSIGVLGFLYANQIEKPEGRRNEKSKPPVSSLRSRRQSRVDQRKWNATRTSFGSEIGPNLRLYQNDPRWPNYRKRPSHNGPVIDRCVHHFDPLRRVLVRESESGRGGRSQNAAQIGIEGAQCVGYFQRNVHFSDTDCVQPRR